MEKYVIKGGNVLEGEVTIAGAKNAALGILAAAVLTDEECIIDNVPYVEDTKVLLKAIENLGAKVKSAGYSSSAVDTAVNNTKSQYKDKYTETDGSASSAKNYNSITKHQTRGASSGHHSENEYSID